MSNKECVRRYQSDPKHREAQKEYMKGYIRLHQRFCRNSWLVWFEERGYKMPDKKLANYHHKKPESRSFVIGEFIYNYPKNGRNELRLQEEIDKCVPLTRTEHNRVHNSNLKTGDK